MRKQLLLLSLGFLCLSGRALAQESPENYRAELGVVFWKPSPDIIVSSGGLATNVDFINTFHIEDKWFPDVRIVLKPGRKHKVRFSTVPIKYDGSATLNQRITFRGQTYNVGVPTTSEVKWTLVRFGYEWDAVATNMGFVGLFTDIKYNKITAQLSAAPVGTQSFDRNVPVPTIGGIGRGYVTPFVSITGEFTGLKFNHGDFSAHFYDFDVYGTANFGRNVGAQVGYRSMTVDYDIEKDAGNLKLKGPYLGGVIRF